VIGKVTRSFDQVLTFADEISEFTKIPAATPQASSIGFREVRAGNT
jgi:hypothetical protein